MRSQEEIQTEINSLQTSIHKVRAQVQAQGRDMTRVEAKLVSDMEDAVNEAKHEAPAPLTLPGNSTFNALSNSTGPFGSITDQLLAVRQAGTPGGQVDSRLYDIRAATGLGETVPSEGAFLLQEDFSSALLKSVFETGILAPKCMRFTISNPSNSIKIAGYDETSRVGGSRFGGVTSYWLQEAGEKLKSKPKFRQIELNLHKLIGLCYASDEIVADVKILEAVIRQAFVSEFGFRIDDAIIRGTGAGEPLGLLNAASLVTVAKETGQAADTVMAENVLKMYSHIIGTKKNYTWLINQNVEPQLYSLHLDVGTGGIPVFMPANGLSGLPYDTLFGIPILAIEQASSIGDAGDIILADFPNGYVLGEKGGIKSDVSIHILFEYDESAYRFVLRIDGQPALGAAITPYKGAAGEKKGHFITLEAR